MRHMRSLDHWDMRTGRNENIRNIVRIVGEDTEAINYNELAYSADEASAVAFNDTLTAQRTARPEKTPAGEPPGRRASKRPAAWRQGLFLKRRR